MDLILSTVGTLANHVSPQDKSDLVSEEVKVKYEVEIYCPEETES